MVVGHVPLLTIINHYEPLVWLMGYNIITGFNMIVSQIYGMSSFPLTFIFFKMVKTINQYFLDIF